MFDIFLDYVKKILKSRLFPITLIYLALFAVVINRLFVLQIVKGPVIVKESEIKRTSQREIKSTRGNIYDRNGKLLASNVLSYAVVMEDNSKIETNDQRNEIIDKLIKIIENNGDTLDTDFFIKQNKQGDLEFTVDGTALTRFLKQVYTYILDADGSLTEEQMKSYLKSNYDYLVYNTPVTNDQKTVMAKDAYEFLRDGTGNNFSHMFGISKDYSVDDALKIMSVRYALFCNYPKYLQVTIASSVTDGTQAAIKENSAELPGVEVVQQTQRVYEDALYFAHIIGYTGLISSDELDEKQTEGLNYNSSDYIGKAGIEKEYEDALRGAKGSESITLDSTSGKVIDVVDHTDPVAGNDIYLTIDADLQRNVYHLLEREIASILLMNIVPDMDYGSKGESATDIKIPIYEVYYALINNNIIDITTLNNPGATTLEKDTYTKYVNARKDIFAQYNELLKPDSSTLNSKAGDMSEFLDYFYQVLIEQKVLQRDIIPTDDATFNSYKNGNISLSSLLQYAITNNWVDLAKLGIGGDYSTAGEIYQKLVDYTENFLKTDDRFNKKIYRKLVFSYKLTGKEICLLLFDQGVLEYKEEDKNDKGFLDGTISPYEFIRSKISALEITPAMLALEPCSGSVVITDVNTGDVLALVTYPSYDNNRFANKIEYKYFKQLQNDKTRPMINRAVAQLIAPGSTFKMVTSFAALEEGVVTPTERILDLGIFDKVSPAAKCHIYPGSHGSVNLSDALKVSCNYFFYEMGWRLSLNGAGLYDEQLGLSRLQKYATLFGLNETSGIELNNELNPKMSNTDAVRSAIGQGSNVYTPAQMARYVTTLASHGKCYDLTILDKVVNKNGTLIKDNNANVIHNISNVKSSTWDTVLQGMYEVVNNPNGGSVYSYFKNFPITVAGKTGTSQITKVDPNNALFISFAPYNKPEIAVAVVIPNGYNSHNAAELAKNIYSLYFKVEDPKNLVEGDVKTSDVNAGGAIE